MAQPTWFSTESSEPSLHLFNSFTRKKEKFVPLNGKRVSWYSCGPTVYDASHMGHARSYISFDILKRVMRDYFGYQIFYCMNITDIDDKIIRRARQNYLFDRYLESKPPLSQIRSDLNSVLETHSGMWSLQLLTEQHAAETDPAKSDMFSRLKNRLQNSLEVFGNGEPHGDGSAAGEGSVSDAAAAAAAARRVLSDNQDVLADWLDRREGASVSDNSIFASLPRHWEAEYFRDMAALNVEGPDCLTRVSEFIPEIVLFVERIISNGYGYESQGSVYFDTENFSQAEGHHYAKLVPEAVGDSKALQEGEGDLSVSSERLREKRSANDFALWKASKPGEPAWDSPWGKGRPGWHIECSVMCSAVLGSTVDIHTGGVDLKFPHHDNEIAQAEAHFGHDRWISYFLHSGHLTIQGCKMSKSLKNFVTIRQALEQNTARQLRLAFLLHAWHQTLDYSPNTMQEALQFEKKLNEFFLVVKDQLRGLQLNQPAVYGKWGPDEHELNLRFQERRAAVHEALCDNVDTRRALEHIRELVGVANAYLRRPVVSGVQPDPVLLHSIARYVTYIMQVFGASSDQVEIGFSDPSESTSSQIDETVTPLLEAFADFREVARKSGREHKLRDLLCACDALRDEILPELGVLLEDRDGGRRALIKLIGREAVRRQRAERQQAARERKAEQARVKEAKEAQNRISPAELFSRMTDKYSQFDEKGFPTHDVEGNELSKKAMKKATAMWDAQARKYAQYQEQELNRVKDTTGKLELTP